MKFIKVSRTLVTFATQILYLFLGAEKQTYFVQKMILVARINKTIRKRKCPGALINIAKRTRKSKAEIPLEEK